MHLAEAFVNCETVIWNEIFNEEYSIWDESDRKQAFDAWFVNLFNANYVDNDRICELNETHYM